MATTVPGLEKCIIFASTKFQHILAYFSKRLKLFKFAKITTLVLIINTIMADNLCTSEATAINACGINIGEFGPGNGFNFRD